MTTENKQSLLDHFSDLTDPREEINRRHLLKDILVIGICATIAGADGWEDIEDFAKLKEPWLKGFLELPGGIPSHDTISRVFARLNPQEFERAFVGWIQSVRERTEGEVIAIDGKMSRGSHNKAVGKTAIDMVSAWARTNHLVLGQVKVDDKSNEITAIPELLQLLDIKGCIVTIDAMGCQKEIARQIVCQGGDYVLALKGNQGTFYSEAEQYFDWALSDKFKQTEFTYHETTDGGHGRIEIRRYFSSEDLDWFAEKGQWEKLRSITMVESEREVIGGEKSVERRYYISSLAGCAQRVSEPIRGHWGIENSLHWVLDVAFREDDSRIRKDNAPENMAVMRHIALSLLKQEKTLKRGVKAKRLHAALDTDYLAKVLMI